MVTAPNCAKTLLIGEQYHAQNLVQKGCAATELNGRQLCSQLTEHNISSSVTSMARLEPRKEPKASN